MKLSFIIPNEYVQKSAIFLPPTLDLKKFPTLSYLFLKNLDDTFYSDEYYIVYYEHESFANIFTKEEMAVGNPVATFDFNGRFYIVYKKDEQNKYFKHVYKKIYNVVDGVVYSKYSAINESVKDMIIDYYHYFHDIEIYKEAIKKMFYKIFNPEKYYDELTELLSYDRKHGEISYQVKKHKEYYSAIDVEKETLILPDKYIKIIKNSEQEIISNNNETNKLIF